MKPYCKLLTYIKLTDNINKIPVTISTLNAHVNAAQKIKVHTYRNAFDVDKCNPRTGSSLYFDSQVNVGIFTKANKHI